MSCANIQNAWATEIGVMYEGDSVRLDIFRVVVVAVMVVMGVGGGGDILCWKIPVPTRY